MDSPSRTSNGATAIADVTSSTFSGNPTNGAIMQTDGANSSATGYFKNCTFNGNGNGVTATPRRAALASRRARGSAETTAPAASAAKKQTKRRN